MPFVRNSVLILILLSLTSLVNCSEVDFAHSQSSTSENPFGDADGTINQPGGEDGNNGGNNNDGGNNGGNNDDGGNNDGPPATPQIVPRVVFIGPPCMRGTNCLIEFELDMAYPLAVEFNWRTNDTLYLQTPPPGQPIYGRPDLHYVPTSGYIKFQPGETRKQAYVQNINPYNIPIIIGVRMSNCRYNGALYACTEFFR